jgi:hypothetical protein
VSESPCHFAKPAAALRVLPFLETVGILQLDAPDLEQIAAQLRLKADFSSAVPNRWIVIQRGQCHHCRSNLL